MAEKALVHRMEQAALTTKIRLLDLAHQTLIHIGGDLSVCDMMTAIWQYAMHYDVKDPHWEGRDRFVLSKGHAAAVTSFSQAASGCYDVGDIYKEYATNFGRFGMHSCNLANPYVDVSTGSLGHGFPVASGMATALKRKGSSSRVYTVVGDGECGEGSIWEAAMYASISSAIWSSSSTATACPSTARPRNTWHWNRSQTNGARSAGTPSPSMAMT